jgi:phosphoesterase RecJ-like protein
MEPVTPDFASLRSQFYALIEPAQRIVITAHTSPDDDSIGSVMSVYDILSTKYPQKNIRIVYLGAPVQRYHVFDHFKNIEFVPIESIESIEADVLVTLDVSRHDRSLPVEAIKNIPITIVIDHHASAPDPFTLSIIFPQYSSNCELVYEVLGAESILTPVLAQSLLLGILGDTGNFSYVSPSQSGVFIVAKKLVDMVGVSIDSFRARYGGIPQRIIPLLQELVKNAAYTTIEGWPPFQYSFIDRTMVAAGKYSDEDLSAASHIYMGQYLCKVQGYGWGFVLTPRSDGGVRMSGRSVQGSVNVRDMHERLGIGGGHDRASGGNFKKENIDREPKQCIVEVLDWMGHNAPLIG